MPNERSYGFWEPGPVTGPQRPTVPHPGPYTESPALRVLVLEEGFFGSGSLQQACASAGLTVDWARDVRGLTRRLRSASYRAILIGLPVPGVDLADLDREIGALDPELADRLVFIVHDLGDPAARRFLTDVGRPFLTRPVTAEAIHDLVVRVGLHQHGSHR